MSIKTSELTVDEVKKISHLARIAIYDNQAYEYAQSLTHILEMMQTLQNTDTDGVQPLFSPHDEATPLRQDQALLNINRTANQQCAPLTEDGLYLVPKVIE